MAQLGGWPEIDRARLVGLCAAISGDHDAAEDLAQETLLEAWRHRGKLVSPEGADRWLAAIARNVCLRWGRTRGRLPIPVETLPEAVAAPEDRVADLLELLPPASRGVMEQRFVHERSHAAIAASLGISTDAVGMRLARGKQALRRALAETEWQPSRVRCPLCGNGRLLMRRDASEVAFTCTDCAPRELLIRYPLANPQFARLVRDLERPTAMFRRVGDWVLSYFAAGAGAPSACTRCGAATTVQAHRREGAVPGLHVHCSACGEDVWSALTGISAALPAVQALRPYRLVEVREERSAVSVVQASLDGSRRVAVGFDPLTFALLGTG